MRFNKRGVCRVCGFNSESSTAGDLCRYCIRFSDLSDDEILKSRVIESEDRYKRLIKLGFTFQVRMGLLARCETCGRYFIKTRANRRFCNDDCRNYRHRPEKECPTCGKIFKPTHNLQIYCKDECKPHFVNNDRTRVCRECGKVFITPKISKPDLCRDCRGGSYD